MKTAIAGAMLLALTTSSWAADTALPFAGTTGCVPYAEMMAAIDKAGGHVLDEAPTPLTRRGTELLTYEYHGIVAVTGMARNRLCVYAPSAVLGRLKGDPEEL